MDILGRGTSHLLQGVNKDCQLFITGCYDGMIRVWNVNNSSPSPPISGNKPMTFYRGHLGAIKGITSLYTDHKHHYFASACKDRSVKVFSMDSSTHQIKEIGKRKKKKNLFSPHLPVSHLFGLTHRA